MLTRPRSRTSWPSASPCCGVLKTPNGKTNLSIVDVGGEVLLVSQFTLYADLSRGRRPGFTNAAPPDAANALVDYFGDVLRQRGLEVAQGQFGAHMQVSLVNDGPFTIWLDTATG